MSLSKISQFARSSRVFQKMAFLAGPLVVLSVATPAFAHHAMGGQMPANFFEGFMSGLAHPLIGLDHFAFVVAVGLLALTRKQGLLMPLAFVLAAMVGTGLHLTQLSVPGVELLVSGSILLFGLLLVAKNQLNTWMVVGLSALAGLFHGYAYGEAIFGAEMTPLLAYLTGFTVIQLGVSLAAFAIGKAVLLGRESMGQISSDRLRPAGLVICGVGLAFFVSQLVSVIFPMAGA